ncbi:mitochondrial carrier domain-containing protein [Blastocladiella britannica]|nr:mitochondrial carrier domain-containing protein [Blastocladiella britannica]
MGTSSSINDFIAGALSGGLGVLVGSPLDVVKVRLQTAVAASATMVPLANGGGGGTVLVTPPTATTTSTWNMVSALVRREGVTSLFRGVASPVLGVAAMNSVLFMSYSNALSAVQGWKSSSSASSSARGSSYPPSIADVSLAGLAAGFACFTISTPTELIKCRAQVIRSSKSAASQPPFRLVLHPTLASWTLPAHNSLAVAARVLTTRGPTGFYRGGLITLLRDSPGYAVYFAGYEGLKHALARGTGRSAADDRAVQFWAGGGAGVLSWASIYPLDVIKSRIQVTDAPLVGSLRAGFQESVAVARTMLREEGARVFFRGMQPALVRAFYVNAVTFVTYEVAMDWLSSARKDEDDILL